MNKAVIGQNFVMPSFQIVNRNQQSTELILMDPENGNLYLLHQYFCTDSEDYGELIALLETQSNQQAESPYVLNPVVYLPIKYTDPNFRTSHFVQVLYEYGSHTLQQQLNLRIQQKNYFEEHQIWSILGSCILGLENLKSKQFNHSSICLNDIFVTKEGQIKICHPMFRTYDHQYGKTIDENYIEKVLNENYYFAPEQIHKQKLQEEQQSTSQPSHPDNAFKSDIFSLGMTVISLCILHPMSDCYVKKGTNNAYSFMIESKKLEQHFYALQHGYSQELVSLLFHMLSYQPQDRLSVDQLAEIINEMIEAKRQEEQNKIDESQQCHQRDEFANSKIQKKYQNQYPKQQTDEQFGKFSQVSQASPIKSRKSNRSSHHVGLKIVRRDPDLEDKPSLVTIECQIDIESFDNAQNDQENYLQNHHADQNHSLNQEYQNSKQIDNISQSIDQTLKQYINQQSESSVSEVNQTKNYEQNQKILNKKNPSSPQEVVSIVMTSKQLSSLPSDSVSFVVQKQIIDDIIVDKQNQPNLNNIFVNNILVEKNLKKVDRLDFNNNNLHKMNNEGNNKSKNNTKSFLQTIKTQNQLKELHQQQSSQKFYPFSARTYNEHGQDSNITYTQFNPSSNKINANIHKIDLETSMNSSMNISLNKNYESFMTNNHHTDQNSMYTNPKFLQAMRQDVSKILRKRKFQVTTSRNARQQQINLINQQTLIQCSKVSQQKSQQKRYTNVGFSSKNIHYR